MNFVTLQEARRVNAVRTNKARELTPTERILMAGVQLSQKPKYEIEELKALCNLMLETTGGERLADKLKEAVNDPAAMQSLIEVYPQVEFHDVIRTGVATLNPFERLYYENRTMADITAMTTIISSFHEVLKLLPTGRETFIHTTFTNVHALRAEWDADKKQTKYLGYALPLDAQRAVNEFTGAYRSGGSPFGVIISRDMLNNKGLWRRAKKAEPVSDFELSYYEDQKFTTNRYILVATNKKTATSLYFCV